MSETCELCGGLVERDEGSTQCAEFLNDGRENSCPFSEIWMDDHVYDRIQKAVALLKRTESGESVELSTAELATIKRLRAGESVEVRRSEIIGPKHNGMRMSASGLLTRIKELSEGNKWALVELHRHLWELSKRFYGGDIGVVDEFLQLYALDNERPTAEAWNRRGE